MDTKNPNEELQSRREFFKKAAKAALPVVGAVVLSSLPIVKSEAQSGGQMWTRSYCNPMLGDACLSQCGNGCSGSCQGDCKGNCKGDCTGGNSNGGSNNSSGCYNGSCQSSCSGGCKNSCYRSCKTGCDGYNVY